MEGINLAVSIVSIISAVVGIIAAIKSIVAKKDAENILVEIKHLTNIDSSNHQNVLMKDNHNNCGVMIGRNSGEVTYDQK